MGNYIEKEKTYDKNFAITQKEFLIRRINYNGLFDQENPIDPDKNNVIKSLLMESFDNLNTTDLSKKIDIFDILEPLKDEISNKLKKELHSLIKEERNISMKNIKIETKNSEKLKKDEEEAYKNQKNELDKWEPMIRKNREKEHLVFQNLEPVDERTLMTFEEKINVSTSYLFSDITALNQNYFLPKKQFPKKVKKTNNFIYNVDYKKNKRKKKSQKSLDVFLKEKKDVRRTRLTSKAKILNSAEKASIEERFKLRHKGMSNWTKRQKKRSFLDSLTLEYLKEQHARGRSLSKKKLVREQNEIHVEEDNFIENEFRRFNSYKDLILHDRLHEYTFMKKTMKKRKNIALRTLEQHFLNCFDADEEGASNKMLLLKKIILS